ncbi:hypothetical protein [Calothrix sp. PCC 7507]|nr:hypothetical protein [Calothrix sp. PCC 7507]AFY30635.1 hypothetical protein Cal7507_0131 [Calothrix sp. PCC 7507]
MVSIYSIAIDSTLGIARQANLNEVKQKRLMEEQAARDDFWSHRDAGL